MVKRLGVPAVLLLMISSAAHAQTRLPAGDALSRLAYFSPQRAFALSADGRAAAAKLSVLEAEKTKEIAARTARLNDLRDALQRSQTVLDEIVRRQRELEIQRFEIDVKRFVEDASGRIPGCSTKSRERFLREVTPRTCNGRQRARAAVRVQRGFGISRVGRSIV